MRIIAGTHRHRPILPPRDERTTRPITDRVKQSLFDRLTAMEAFGEVALDIFAGTGSLGLEALSRGVDHCTFVERDRSARSLLERNLEALQLADRATILSIDALSLAWINLLPRQPVALFFCDPPYKLTAEDQPRAAVMGLVQALAAVAEEGAVLVLRSDERITPEPAPSWEGPDSVDYGSMRVHFYRKALA